jgi:hypothetical protein
VSIGAYAGTWSRIAGHVDGHDWYKMVLYNGLVVVGVAMGFAFVWI